MERFHHFLMVLLAAATGAIIALAVYWIPRFFAFVFTMWNEGNEKGLSWIVGNPLRIGIAIVVTVLLGAVINGCIAYKWGGTTESEDEDVTPAETGEENH